jgi:Leu/Phe-tRNA-protein transferase
LDIQQWTAHTGSLGAITIPRREYLRRLAGCVQLEVTFGEHLEGQDPDPLTTGRDGSECV